MFLPGPFAQSEVVLIRHAPAAAEGRLCGRSDVPARIDAAPGLAATRAVLDGIAQHAVSPALRCRQTFAALWPDLPLPEPDDRLWEQDFGAWEGRDFHAIPDLGPLTGAALAAHRPPQGESFDDLCARVHPALQEKAAQALDGGPVAVVAHAGTVRAALALALGGSAAALLFEVAPLSLTRLRALPGGGLSVVCTNWSPQ